MQNFESLGSKTISELFFLPPETFTKDSPREVLAVALGATLYTPATRENLANDVLKMKKHGATSVIICLEDSIPDKRLEEAEANLAKMLKTLSTVDPSELPLLFVRPRDPQHLMELATNNLSTISLLTGFSLPKFNKDNASYYLQNIHELSQKIGQRMYAMPILESPSLIFAETRQEELRGIAAAFDAVTDWDDPTYPTYREYILNLRIGATDMSSPFGLRRSRDLSIYDVKLISNVIEAIVNKFGRDKNNYVISGPVWEHFVDRERLFKPVLRQSPFNISESQELRRKLILKDLDGLIREVELDRANGLCGKTVIHPSHVSLVNSMMVVSHEEYSDALAILHDDNDGAIASTYRNKMNEIKPHTNWANKVVLRAKAFGVLKENINFIELMETSIS